jgi:hypothetical protein
MSIENPGCRRKCRKRISKLLMARVAVNIKAGNTANGVMKIMANISVIINNENRISINGLLLNIRLASSYGVSKWLAKTQWRQYHGGS